MHNNWGKPFLMVYIGQAFSLLSSSAVQFAIIWWVTVETGSAMAITLATVVGLLPQVLIGSFAGVWIDHYQPKAIMILADSSVALSSLVLAVAFAYGKPSLLFVYTILAVRALGETFHKPAMQTAIPQLVPKHDLTRAGGFGQMITSACTMVGPMLGAFLMEITTLPYVMLVDVIGALLAVLTLSAVKLGQSEAGSNSGLQVFSNMRAGLEVIWSNQALMRASLPVFMTSIVFMPLGSLLPLMVKEYFLGGAWYSGIVRTVFSAGMLTGAMAIGVTGGMRRQFLMISLASCILGACSLMGGLLPSNAFWLFCLLVYVMGISGMCGSIPYTAYIQRTVPHEHLGKVLALVTSIMSLGIPIGMVLAGTVTETIGVSQWMVVAGVMMLGTGILSLLLTRDLAQKVECVQSLPSERG